MLVRIAVSVALVLGVFYSSSSAQQTFSGQNVYQETPSSVPFAPVAFSTTNTPSTPTSRESLENELVRMQARLSELEYSVQQNLTAPTGALGTTSPAGTDDVSDRLADLEERFKRQTKAVEKIEDGLPGMVFSGHKTPKMKLFGRIHLDYWAFPDVDETVYPIEGLNPQDRFNFRRLRIGVSGDLNDNMFYKFEGEFAAGNNPSYRDAYIGFKNLPHLRTLIIGNQKRPYGLDHLNSSRYNVFLERPFIVEALNQDSRRLGISSNGFSENLGWNWRYGVWNQILTQTRAGYIGDHYQLEFAARLARTAWYDESSGGRGYAHFAISGAFGTPDGRPGTLISGAHFRTRPEARTTARWLNTGVITGANANALMGVESMINIGSFNFTAEYMRTNIDRKDAIGEDVAFDGGYAQVAYLLTGEHRPWNREKGTFGRLKPFENFFRVCDCDGNLQRGLGAWEIAARYSFADLDDYDIRGGNAESYTFGLNWYLSSHSRMQFNYILGELDPGTAASGYGDYQIFGMRLMVDF